MIDKKESPQVLIANGNVGYQQHLAAATTAAGVRTDIFRGLGVAICQHRWTLSWRLARLLSPCNGLRLCVGGAGAKQVTGISRSWMRWRRRYVASKMPIVPWCGACIIYGRMPQEIVTSGTPSIRFLPITLMALCIIRIGAVTVPVRRMILLRTSMWYLVSGMIMRLRSTWRNAKQSVSFSASLCNCRRLIAYLSIGVIREDKQHLDLVQFWQSRPVHGILLLAGNARGAYAE